MKVIGVTGGVGAGKSEILTYIAENWDAAVVETDEVGYLVMRPGKSCFAPIVELFGPGILQEDGTLDRAKIAELVFGDKELLEKLTADESESEESQDKMYSQIVQGMLDAVDKNCGMSLSLESFAEKYHMTPEYISNLFAKEVGTSFSNYKKKVRIDRAKILLLTTDMKVYEVACAVGYPDQKYFSRVFKEYTGVSAKQFPLKYYLEGNEIKLRK